ncbi:GNAT family N-acetyltransferase [Qipengyuania aurantiaca]|uniref:GNAT family N-acetyltransferase n=1 Tax=Qipengyuania aurantiaca TaxID=2867233 RepID=A0ABX8ZJZ7_9SPHN|nr:GNAT family N-acetyltransferase [Qipengyuania aurantiaca]QZD89282.1 GNAT family N-acetyltransferase [Qipengyuania aurantiaca]
MHDTIELVWASDKHHDILADIMYDAVRHGPTRYTEEQREAWVPERRSGASWDKRLARQDIVMARVPDGPTLGFMSLDAGGYIDFAYIRPHAQGRGLFRNLYEAIEAKARAKGERRLWVHASLMAQPAFASMGFSVTEEQVVYIGDQSFERAEMEKPLD